MALLDNSYPRIRKELSLPGGILKTNAALVSMQGPSEWPVSMSTKQIHPDYPPETFLIFNKGDDTKASIGVYFSGVVLDEGDARWRKKEIFDTEINLQAGTPEATRRMAETGMRAQETQLGNILLTIGDHAVMSKEKYCRAIKSSDFNGLKSVICEFENEDTGTRTIEYCIDVLGTGQVIYSLYYRSAIDSFSAEMDTAVAAFKSTVWRKDFDPMKPIEVNE